jgi:hypothetical protein
MPTDKYALAPIIEVAFVLECPNCGCAVTVSALEPAQPDFSFPTKQCFGCGEEHSDGDDLVKRFRTLVALARRSNFSTKLRFQPAGLDKPEQQQSTASRFVQG